MKKYAKPDQVALAVWAADCAERALALFENSYPNDERPQKAIAECRRWVQTGEFKMATIRSASLDAHAAARNAKENDAACFAARAAGQAVATAHVPQHAYGAACYALKATAATNPAHAKYNVTKEFNWQLQHAPENLRAEISKRITIQNNNKTTIQMQKGKDF